MQQQIMLDLETMGTGPNAAIIAIGPVAFTEEEVLNKTFYQKITLESAVSEGGTMDASTVRWWMGQSDEAKSVFLEDGDTDTLSNALVKFTGWVSDDVSSVDMAPVRGCGSDFNNVILRNALEYSNVSPLLDTPWKFWNNRCYRTMKSQFPEVEMERLGTHHNALDDAISQAEHLVQIFKRIRGSK